ncbi:MAG: hypothetical protein C0401_11930 [Anaerolinea sp.]|nr:hypothetical protein [Anaerolinea sp.]
MSLVMRPAEGRDSGNASVLLAETTRGFGVAALGLGKPELQLKALEKWFAGRGNRFSFEHTLIAEMDGAAAGLLLRFAGAKLAALEIGCGRQIFSIYGVIGAFKMIWRNKVLANAKEAEKDEYFIAHLAVDARFRKQGIGQALMERAITETREHGLSKLALEVEIGNDPAIQLYQKMDFKIINTIEFNKKADVLQCPGFHKMLRTV